MMKYLLPTAVLFLMLSIGMSLSLRQLIENWRKLTPSLWIRLLCATFIIPPLLALGLGWVLPLGTAVTAGLFLVAVAPGAPLMIRGVSKKGYDLHVAASYQVWGAMLVPLMIPLLVAGGGWLYGRNIWVPPMKIFWLIARQQFLPLLAGMALMRFAPVFCTRSKQILNLAGNALLTVALVAILFKLGPALMQMSPWLCVAAPLLAAGCLLSVRLLLGENSPTVQALSISNANRHVGLALLMVGQNLQDQRPVPAIAAYALAAMLVMALYAKFARRNQWANLA
ncbi:MAG: bile acid:sodium symporter [Verrucomicrobiota bacterium]